MCGIIGYVGPRSPLDVVLSALRRLEYRGYDSAGVGVVADGRVRVVKREGPLEALEAALDGLSSGADGLVATAIGHTRWATHGAPSDRNAHPHTDERSEVAIVHNGIIENEGELRRELEGRGHRFRSETDTEVVAHLLEEVYRPDGPAGGDLAEAVRLAVARLKGAFAFVVASAREPGRIVVVRQASPIVIGLGEGENFVASDIPALIPYTRRVITLADGDMADVRVDRVALSDLRGRPVDRRPFTVSWDLALAERGGYPHFMLKEIHEQPDAWRRTLAGRVDGEGRVRLTAEAGRAEGEAAIEAGREEAALISVTGSGEKEALARLLAREFRRVAIVACGSAYHAGLVGKALVERWAKLPVEVDVASEFRYREPLVGEDTLAIAISQSGETIDTLAALREAKALGAGTLAIVNSVGSIIAREADAVLPMRAGPEISVCSTKAYTTPILCLALLALELAARRGTMDEEARLAVGRELLALPDRGREALATDRRAAELAKRLATCEDVFFIGRGLDYAAAMEAQLKLKEISYIHAEAYAAGELKHGTLALVTEGVPVVALATQPELMDKVTSNIREVEARGAWVIAVATDPLLPAAAGPAGADAGAAPLRRRAEGTRALLPESVRDVLAIAPTHPLLAPAVAAIPLQLLAYHAAVRRGSPVDKPRNLAKSVTVE
ncbi:MAG: glutamine--fructose-6-phosphate transaminase (isomerizing) [Clostridia bacterium]|nr:glutamine--fructose-6-phosphate transaminase (isomerizing) [Clostridia bacterium]